MDDAEVYASYVSAAGKLSPTGGTEVKGSVSEMMVGYERKMKSDSSHFFYGANYNMTTAKNDRSTFDTKVESTTLPVYFGIEAEAASWLTLRGQVSKAVLIDTVKITEGTGGLNGDAKAAGAGTANVAFGGSWKFNKSAIDFAFTGTSTGGLGLGTFGSNASYTYSF